VYNVVTSIYVHQTLLLSSATDGKTLCWDVDSGTVLCEFDTDADTGNVRTRADVVTCTCRRARGEQCGDRIGSGRRAAAALEQRDQVVRVHRRRVRVQ
jgi:outer membrane protein assembly factor BamB